MRVLVAGAVLGACLIAIPAAVEPDVEHQAVKLTAAGDSVDLTSPFTVMSDGLGGVGALDNPLPELVNAMSAVAGAADADPLADFWQQIMNYFEAAALFGLLIFGGVVANVANIFVDAYNWVAEIFGFEPYGGMDALGSGLPAFETSAGDITVPFSDVAVPWESPDLIGELVPALDSSGVTDVASMLDDGVMADIGALVSG